MVPADPTVEDMKKVVIAQQKRPFVPNRWSENSVSMLINNYFIFVILFAPSWKNKINEKNIYIRCSLLLHSCKLIEETLLPEYYV